MRARDVDPEARVLNAVAFDSRALWLDDLDGGGLLRDCLTAIADLKPGERHVVRRNRHYVAFSATVDYRPVDAF